MKTLFHLANAEGADAFESLTHTQQKKIKTKFFWRWWSASDDWWDAEDATQEQVLTHMLSLTREMENTIRVYQHMEIHERESSTSQTN